MYRLPILIEGSFFFNQKVVSLLLSIKLILSYLSTCSITTV